MNRRSSRVLRACREAGLRAVAVHAEDEAGALHTELADISLPLEGSGAPAYLNGEAIIAAALANDVDGIHPGFGFLSERAGFAQAVIDAGLIWIGPSPSAIERMGDKMTARITMREAGVPVIPGEEIEIESTGDEDADLAATLSAVRDASARVGFPLLLKASAGGGGKGMRAVESADGLDEAVRGARREAIAAFGDGRVYLERLLRGARHVEVQVLADAHGTTVHLGERECSVQRRHQKVFEEAPREVVARPAVKAQREFLGRTDGRRTSGHDLGDQSVHGAPRFVCVRAHVFDQANALGFFRANAPCMHRQAAEGRAAHTTVDVWANDGRQDAEFPF